MARRSIISDLPDDIRAELERRLVKRGFNGYQELAEWLGSEGYKISHSSVHRFGQKFERRLGTIKVASEQARAITEAARDDEGLMGDALTSLVQEKAFDTLLNLKTEDLGVVSLPAMGRMIADLNRASINQKKWQAEVRNRTRSAAKEVEKIARDSGLSDNAVGDILTKIMGIPS